VVRSFFSDWPYSEPLNLKFSEIALLFATLRGSLLRYRNQGSMSSEERSSDLKEGTAHHCDLAFLLHLEKYTIYLIFGTLFLEEIQLT
jgi:hypothetical protein